MKTRNEGTVSVDKTVRIIGFASGLRFPSLIAGLSLAVPQSRFSGELSGVSVQLKSLFESLDMEFEDIESETVGDFLLNCMFQICQAGNAPVYEKGVLVSDTGSHCVLALPLYGTTFPATTNVLSWLVNAVNSVLDGKSIREQEESFSGVLAQLKRSGPDGFNTPRFLRAAFEADIPTTVIAGGVVQYGQGAKSRWLNSSFTEGSSAMAAGLTRNKELTSRVLRQAGLPVASHALCTSVEDAVNAANKIGFPVVIKPADQDGGVAVAAGLTTEDEVRTAFSVALDHSQRILVEKHVFGRDYRLNVFNEDLLWAIERIPAGITGDGQSTIQQLIDQENTDPRRAKGKHSSLKMLVLDKEALTVLKNRGQQPGDVPGIGEFVPLRRNANISTGGTPVAVMDNVHPDNRSLAIRSAAALRLDMAGVDIICRDISRSWKESGAVICEVNGQPQLGGVTCPHVYGQILQALVEGNGRIPIVLVLGAPPDSSLASEIFSYLRTSGLTAGLADRTGITIGEERIVEGEVGFYSAGQILIRNSAVEAVVMDMNNSSALHTGLPFDRFDLLIIAGRQITFPERVPPQQRGAAVQDIFKLLLSACTGKAIVPKKFEKNLRSMSQWTTAEWTVTKNSGAQLAESIASELITAAARKE